MRNMFKLRSLAMTIIPLILCVGLLIGVTFAWFTSEVTNKDNNIEAGTLALDLLKYDINGGYYKDIGEEKLFDNGVWEPGTTKIVYLAVVNSGSLSLTYNIKLTSEEGAIALTDVMEYAVISPMSRDAGIHLNNWAAITAEPSVKVGNLVKGELTAAEGKAMNPGDMNYLMLAVHMKDDAASSYQGGWLELDLEIVSKQIPGETDFFGNQYDANAGFVNGAVSSAYWYNLVKDGPYDFEGGLGKSINVMSGTVTAVDDLTRPDSTKVMKMDPSSKAQFQQKSNTAELTAGFYKVSGFVKLGNADPTKVSLNIWAYKNSLNGTNLISPVIADCITVEADENGWSYFEVIFDHGSAYSLLQFNINNSDTENAVYFDDFQYLKYVGKEELPSLGGEVLEPSDPNEPWTPFARLDFEGSNYPMTEVSDKYPAGTLGSIGRKDSAQSLQLDANARAKFSKEKALNAGYYRVSGYVKLGDVNPSKISINIWAYTGTKEGNLQTRTMAQCIVSQPDEDGWCRFEVIFQHKANYTLMQFTLFSAAGKAVYLDDIEYEMYTGEGEPTAKDPVTPDIPVIPDAPAETWTNYAELDFEGTEFPMIQINSNPLGSFGTPGHGGSAQALQLDGGERARFSQTAELPAGYYRLTGYVKLGDAQAKDVSIDIWAYTGTKEGNLQTRAMTQCVVSEPDKDGWCAFEIIFEHKAKYTLMQLNINNANKAKTVYFDDIVYEKYNGEGLPPAQDLVVPESPVSWSLLAGMDFEGTEFPMIQIGSNPVGSFGAPGHKGSAQALQLDGGERARYSQTVDLGVGYYRLTGYVKLGDAQPKDVSIDVWAYTGTKEGNLQTRNMTQCVVSEPDENGWRSFEIIFQHQAKYTLIQFNVVNANKSKTVYFDDFAYEKYDSEGVPTAQTPVVPEAPSNWSDLAALDFEGSEFPMIQINSYPVGAFGTSGYKGSAQALQLDGGERARYSQTADLAVGYYRLAGYVKLGDAQPEDVSIDVWAYTGTKEGNLQSRNMLQCIVSEPDENGWCSFEIIFQHQAKYSVMQYNVVNGSGKTVYFDNISYQKYEGDGEPTAQTPVLPQEPPVNPPTPPVTPPDPPVADWTVLDVQEFEGTDPTFVAATSNNPVGGLGNPGQGGSAQAMQLDATEAIKYSHSMTLAKGWYRLTGYVKLGNVAPANVVINVWAYTGTTSGNTQTKTMAECIVSQPDENGWCSFEIIFQHQANYSLIQYTIYNYNTAHTVYFDNISYEKYNKDGQPTPQDPVTPGNPGNPDDSDDNNDPATPNPPDTNHWTVYGEQSFSADALETQWSQKAGTSGLSTGGGHTGSNALYVDNASRAQYSKALSPNMPAGWYRLSGYVNLNGADASKVSITVWAYTGTSSGNTKEQLLSNCNIGVADSNGWCYFELDFEHKAPYSTIQFIINNNKGSGKTVYIDDLHYAKYLGDGAPAATVIS